MIEGQVDARSQGLGRHWAKGSTMLHIRFFTTITTTTKEERRKNPKSPPKWFSPYPFISLLASLPEPRIFLQVASLLVTLLTSWRRFPGHCALRWVVVCVHISKTMARLSPNKWQANPEYCISMMSILQSCESMNITGNSSGASSGIDFILPSCANAHHIVHCPRGNTRRELVPQRQPSCSTSFTA